MTPLDPASVAGRLTKAQREALAERCDPPIAIHARKLLNGTELLKVCGCCLSPLGLAIRAHLLAQQEHTDAR